jgi:23S rRNA (adenine2503-C2)-methyltransferase
MPPPTTIASLDLPKIRQEMVFNGWRTGRAPALLRKIYSREIVAPARFGDPVARWANALSLAPTTLAARSTSHDGTVKLLIQAGNDLAECVLMPTDRPGETAGCVSSQVGCAMGCDFCASTLGGLARNLTADEITAQFLHLREESRARGARLANIVFMGMGEPMLNLDHVLPAVHRIADPSCGGLGYKNVQVSTVGIVPGIQRLADSGLRVQLALSLHGPTDAVRSNIVPAGRKYGVADTLEAAWQYQQRTGRVANIEYCLLAGINDSPTHAAELAQALASRRMHVNLIPYNTIGTGLSGQTYRRPSPETVTAFLAELRQRNVIAHVRKTRGDDASAACGQLRHKSISLAQTR